MKTLHCCSSASWGGLELYASTLMVELRAAGCEVEAICLPGSGVEQFLKDRDVPVHILPGSSTISLSSIRFLRSLINERGVDVVHVHFHKDIWPASLALSLNKKQKLFLSVYLGVPKKKDIFHRFIYRRLNGIFTSSRELCRTLPELYPVPASKIHYLPYGRGLGNYRVDNRKRAEIRSLYGCTESDFLVGTMVRIDPGKGVLDFAKSYHELDEAIRKRTKYLIIGEPTRKSRGNKGESPFEERSESYDRYLKKFIGDAGIGESVLCTGYQPDLIGYLSALDLFVFPSRDELYSLVVLDAMAMGLPVVAAAAGGTLDQIQNGINGLLYPPGDNHRMAQMISSYLCSRDLRMDHGKRAREFVVEHHSMETMIRQLLEYYSSAS